MLEGHAPADSRVCFTPAWHGGRDVYHILRRQPVYVRSQTADTHLCAAMISQSTSMGVHLLLFIISCSEFTVSFLYGSWIRHPTTKQPFQV